MGANSVPILNKNLGPDYHKERKGFGYFGNRKTAIYRVYKKKLDKPEIALQHCKAPQCTKFFIDIGCLSTDNAV